MLQKIFVHTLMSACALAAVSQTPVKSPETEQDKKLKEKAIAFLKETQGDVNTMRTLENRISFTSELASLMWFQDEREARGMFVGVTTDFRELLLQYNQQMNALGTANEEEIGSGSFLIPDESARGRLQLKFRTAMAVRQQIAMSMAEHDPDLAFTFYYESLNAISNPDYRKQAEEQDKYMEFQLINMIADKDPGKAAKFGSKSLSKGFSYQHLDLLKKIYASDPDKAIEFGSDILNNLKGESSKNVGGDEGGVSDLISFGEQTLAQSQTDGKKKAIYSPADLRDLAEVLAQGILDRPPGSGPISPDLMKKIQKYAPGRAIQIKAKFKQRSGIGDGDEDGYGGGRYSNMTANGANSYANAYAANTLSSSANANISPSQRTRLDREKNEKQMMDDVMKVGNKDLPKEQRDAIIAQARKILLLTPGRDKKIAGLSMLAAQVAKAGDRELADQIMKDAEGLVNPQPKNYQDFLLTWMLASGYASANPDKAFPLLQDTIARANDTLAAFVKAAEFIDVNGEIIEDGEVQVGAFGGSMVRDMTRELNMADSTIRVLAIADFDKTKDLTNRFDRQEVRILAKMLVLRAVLGDKNPPKSEGVDTDPETYLK